MQNPFLQTRFQPFLCFLATLALLCMLAMFGPQQLPVVIYKLLLPLLGGFAAVYLWIALVPIGNPARYLAYDWRRDPDADRPGIADFAVAEGYVTVYCVCLACTALAFGAGMLAVAWGL
jgi:hypothetical protein